jgi:hypothetical protein
MISIQSQESSPQITQGNFQNANGGFGAPMTITVKIYSLGAAGGGNQCATSLMVSEAKTAKINMFSIQAVMLVLGIFPTKGNQLSSAGKFHCIHCPVTSCVLTCAAEEWACKLGPGLRLLLRITGRAWDPSALSPRFWTLNTMKKKSRLKMKVLA